MIEPKIFIGLEILPASGQWVSVEGLTVNELYEIGENIVNNYNSLPEHAVFNRAEEYGVMDAEDMPFKVTTFEEAAFVGELASLVDDDKWEALKAWLDAEGYNNTDFDSAQAMVDTFEEKFQGYFDELADYAYDFLVEQGVEKALEGFGLQNHLYALAESVARDMEAGGTIYTKRIDGKTAVFLNY